MKIACTVRDIIYMFKIYINNIAPQAKGSTPFSPGKIEVNKEKKIMKRITGYIRLEIEAGKASPSPPVGPALGLRGLNIMQFCKDFNNECRSQGIKDGTPVPTIITVYDDRTCVFNIKTPSVSYLIKKILNVTKGVAKTGKDIPFIMDTRLLYEVAAIKHKGSNQSLRSVYKSIVGSAKSIGVSIRKY